jgi:hypothetical protein
MTVRSLTMDQQKHEETSEATGTVCVSEIIGNGEGAHRLARIGDKTLTLRMGFPDGVERISGRELARMLEYTRDRKFFELARRVEKERPDFGTILRRPTVGRGLFRGNLQETQTIDEPWFTERQALLLAVESDTTKAWEVKCLIVDIFLALKVMKTALPPAVEVRKLIERQDRLEHENGELRAKVELLDPFGAGVIGDKKARAFILAPLREAARMACIASGDMSESGFRREFKERENDVRTHVAFPGSAAHSWANLPIIKFGEAQTKALSIRHREETKIKRVLREIRRRKEQLDLHVETVG